MGLAWVQPKWFCCTTESFCPWVKNQYEADYGAQSFPTRFNVYLKGFSRTMFAAKARVRRRGWCLMLMLDRSRANVLISFFWLFVFYFGPPVSGFAFIPSEPDGIRVSDGRCVWIKHAAAPLWGQEVSLACNGNLRCSDKLQPLFASRPRDQCAQNEKLWPQNRRNGPLFPLSAVFSHHLYNLKWRNRDFFPHAGAECIHREPYFT